MDFTWKIFCNHNYEKVHHTGECRKQFLFWERKMDIVIIGTGECQKCGREKRVYRVFGSEKDNWRTYGPLAFMTE